MSKAESVDPAVAAAKPRSKSTKSTKSTTQNGTAPSGGKTPRSARKAAQKAAAQQAEAVPKPRSPRRKAAAEPDAQPQPQPRQRLHWQSRGERAAKAILRSLALLLLVLSVLELLMITLVPTPGAVAFSHPNAHPFAAIRLYLTMGTIQEQVFQIGGNLALGFALGFLLPQITPQLRGLIRVEAFTALFVTGIEAVQYLFIPGTPLTVDVLILTAIGAALGYVPLGRMFGMRLHPNHLHWWQRRLSRSVARRRAARSG